MNTRRTLIAALAATLGLAFGLPAAAQTFPTRNVSLVVPFAPGGPTDQIARAVASKMQETLGKPVIVENRPGGGGQIAANAVKQAEADGHTLFVGATEMFAINPTLYRKFSYDPQKDFVPVAGLASTPMILVVPASSPANSVQELVALAKQRTGGLNYASQGPGSLGHMLGELLRTKTGAPLNHVPYKGSAPAMQDLLGGQVDMFFDVGLIAIPQIAGGKIKALGVAAERRAPFLPEARTLTESGVTGMDASVWFAAVARAGTPEAAVTRLNDAINKALASPDIVRRFSDQGMQPLVVTPAQLGTFMRAEASRWTPLVKASGASVE